VLEKFWHFRLQVRLGSRLAGEAMTHFSKEKLVEFVRDALTSTQREEIQQHLHSCRKCTGLVDLYRRVVRVGSDEGSYAPPDGVVLVLCLKWFLTALPSLRPPVSEPHLRPRANCFVVLVPFTSIWKWMLGVLDDERQSRVKF
jgi:hypothetical protein